MVRTGVFAALLLALVAPAPAAERAVKRTEKRTYRRAEPRVSARAAATAAPADAPTDRIFWTGRKEMPGPIVREPVQFDLSRPLAEIERAFQPPAPSERETEVQERVQNNHGALEPQAPIQDPVVQDWNASLIPAPELTFEGLSNEDNFTTVGSRVSPPDTNGDIGPNHYIQSVNKVFAVYDRSGARLVGPLPNSALFAGFGGACQTRNDGDPVVLYDHLADRWMLSQFTTAAPFHQCIAISQTPDPTGAWFRYDYIVPSGNFNDYPKFGVWPDGYYMSAGSRGIPGPTTDVFVFERTQMLTGGVARMVAFTTPSNLGYVTPTPADLDGPLPPIGAPNTFVGMKQSLPQAMYLFRFHADWTNPANSTFGVNGQPNDTINSVAPWTIACPGTRNCIPQPGTSVGLDALAGRYVMFRAQYRNFGTHEAIIFNHTVDSGGGRTGVRWYEVRNPASSPSIFQQGTFAPADGVHRWMGSAAMDRAGNLAVGYSAGNATISAGIRYAGRLASDPPGVLAQGEELMFAASGSQLSTSSRWGDYSMLAVDPTDDCTFWYTTEYYALTSNVGWQSRVGRFRFPSCLLPDYTVTANPNTVMVPVGGVTSTSISVQSLNGFSSLVDLTCATASRGLISCSFSPGGVTPLPNQSAPSTLTFNVDAATKPGSYFMMVEGSDGTVRRSARVDIRVTP